MSLNSLQTVTTDLIANCQRVKSVLRNPTKVLQKRSKKGGQIRKEEFYGKDVVTLLCDAEKTQFNNSDSWLLNMLANLVTQ